MSEQSTTTKGPQGALERFVREALTNNGTKVAELTVEQRVRAVAAPTEKAGLRGKALHAWIMDAKNGRDVIAEQRAQDAKEQRAESTAKRVSSSRDPEAAALAVKAKEFAGVKSPFGPGEARVFLDQYTLTAADGKVTVRHGAATGVEGALEEATLSIAQVKAFTQGHALDSVDDQKAIRQAMSGLGAGTVLWGRKLGAFISVSLPEGS